MYMYDVLLLMMNYDEKTLVEQNATSST